MHQTYSILGSQHIALPNTFKNTLAPVVGARCPAKPCAGVLCLPQVPLEEREQRLRLAAFDPATDVQNLKVVYQDPALEGGCMSRKQLSQIK